MKRLACVAILCKLSISSAAHAATVRTVALSGQQAPGAPDGTAFLGFNYPPVLNDAGQTAFRGDSGILSEGSGSLELVATIGQQAPGLPCRCDGNGSLGGSLFLTGASAPEPSALWLLAFD